MAWDGSRRSKLSTTYITGNLIQHQLYFPLKQLGIWYLRDHTIALNRAVRPVIATI